MVKHGLGRGFESLIPTELVDEEFDPTADEVKGEKLVELKISEVEPNKDQPRKNFNEEALNELASSIKQFGVLSPIVVVRIEDKYQIVAGERRFRAAKLAGLSTIPAIVRTLDAQNQLELSIIENAQREDLNAIELATAYAKLKEQFNMDNAQVAERIGKNKTTIINSLRLLKLPDMAKKAMREHNLSEGVMRPLVTAEIEIVEEAVPKIIEEHWTARQVEQFIASHKKRSSAVATKTSIYAKEEVKLADKFKSKVRIGTKSITFSCKNEDELKELIKKLGK